MVENESEKPIIGGPVITSTPDGRTVRFNLRDGKVTTRLMIDPDNGLGYVSFNRGRIVRTEEVTDEKYLDLDSGENVVGVEFLDITDTKVDDMPRLTLLQKHHTVQLFEAHNARPSK